MTHPHLEGLIPAAIKIATDYRDGVIHHGQMVASMYALAAGDVLDWMEEHAAPAAPAPDWTDSQIAEFMAVALRHTEYARGTHGPTGEEIRQGLQRIGAAPRVTGGREADQT